VSEVATSEDELEGAINLDTIEDNLTTNEIIFLPRKHLQKVKNEYANRIDDGLGLLLEDSDSKIIAYISESPREHRYEKDVIDTLLSGIEDNASKRGIFSKSKFGIATVSPVDQTPGLIRKNLLSCYMALQTQL